MTDALIVVVANYNYGPMRANALENAPRAARSDARRLYSQANDGRKTACANAKTKKPSFLLQNNSLLSFAFAKHMHLSIACAKVYGQRRNLNGTKEKKI